MANILNRLFSEEKKHYLLQPQVTRYSNRTTKRAFIVWIQCGQLNNFKHLCDYYHGLEIMEQHLSFEYRLESQIHEFIAQPVSRYFPKLYTPCANNNVVKPNPISQLNLDDSMFDVQDFYKLKVDKSMNPKDKLTMNRMIRSYCDSHSKTLLYVLKQFDQYLKKCELDNTAINMSMFIIKQNLKDELVTFKNTPKDFPFLDISYDPNDTEADIDANNTEDVTANNTEDNAKANSTDEIDVNKPGHSKDPVEEQASSKEQIEKKYQAPEASELPTPEFLSMRNYKRNLIINKTLEDRGENNNYYDDSGNVTENSY